MKANTILDLIGQTPHVKINHILGSQHQVWIKLERNNPGGSIKDRIALSMIQEAEQSGLLKPGGTIIEPTSGNTGIGLAMVGAVKNYKVILVMPESMSIERRRLMQVYGAEFVLTPREKGMKGAIEHAGVLTAQTPGAWMPRQFDNAANPAIHEHTTALEILQDFQEGLDYLITGVGTGGHITGVARLLRQHFPNIKVMAVEPALSPVLSGGAPGPHPLQGIGAGFVPHVLDRTLIDEVIPISQEEAYDFARKAARQEGIFAGISTGASLAAIHKNLGRIPNGARILTFNYDTGERYLSVVGLFDED